MNGKIKTLSKKRGFGFIRNENNEDVFFHLTNLNNRKNFSNIREGDKVEFIMKKGKKGLRAENIKILKFEENDEKKMKNALERLKSFFTNLYVC